MVEAMYCRRRSDFVAEVSDKGMLPLNGGAFAGEALKKLCLCEEYRNCLAFVVAAHYQS
jgi:hypothetical protein